MKILKSFTKLKTSFLSKIKLLIATFSLIVVSVSISYAVPFQIPIGTIGITPSTNQIAFTWTAPQPNGTPVTSYRVEYRLGATGAGVNPAQYQAFNTVNTTASTVTGLMSGITYDFRITPIDNTGDGIVSEITVSTVLDSPINLNGSPTSGGVNLNWSAPQTTSVITDYRIEYREAGTNTAFTIYNDGISSGTSVPVTGLTNGKQYEFKVSAYNGAIGRPSNVVILLAGTTPSNPNNLMANAGLIANTVSLNWTTPTSMGASNITDYTVEYRPIGGAWQVYNDGVSAQTSAGLVGLSPATQYEFRVSAVNSQGTGPLSIVANYTTQANQVAAYPTQVQGVASGANCINLSWIAPLTSGSSAISDYIIEYRTSSNPFMVYVDGVSSNNSALVCNLNPNTYYDFRVTAQNNAGTSTPSQIVSIWSQQQTTTTAVVTPAIVTGAPGIAGAVNFSAANNAVNASWVAGLAGDCPIVDYKVEYKKSGQAWQVYNDGTSTLSSMVISGLANGTPYDFRLAAINCKGAGTYTKDYSVTPSPTAKACLPIITRYLKRGTVNDKGNVERLQTFLRDDEGYSNLGVTGIFGASTHNAVVSFQNKYKSDVLSPWKLTKGSGWVYMTTTKKINDLYCQYHP